VLGCLVYSADVAQEAGAFTSFRFAPSLTERSSCHFLFVLVVCFVAHVDDIVLDLVPRSTLPVRSWVGPRLALACDNLQRR
jgi:hypothetical protein